MVWEVYNEVNIPVVGLGGIFSTDDALEFIIVGASAIQIGTAHFVNPRTAIEVITGIENYLKDHKMNNIQDLVGSLDTSAFSIL